MPVDDDAELRSLQAKAYGRDGALTDAEAARLHELEHPQAGGGLDEVATKEPVGPGVIDQVPARVGPGADAATGRDNDGASSDSSAEARSAPGASALDGTEASGASEDDLRRAARRHWRPVAAASALLLALGLGAGWMLFGRDDGSIALTSEQQERRLALEAEGDFDEGTLRAVGQNEDALLWYGTQSDGELACVVLDADKESSMTACGPIEGLENGIGVGVGVPSEGEDGAMVQISGTAALSSSGEIVALFGRYETHDDVDSWLAQFNGPESVRAEELLGEGFDPYSYSIAGYFREAPVWSGTRIDGEALVQCLIVDAVEATVCGPAEETTRKPLVVQGVDVDQDGAQTGSWTVELGNAAGMTYLTITGDGDLTTVAPEDRIILENADPLELGGEHGDPIEVRPDSSGG